MYKPIDIRISQPKGPGKFGFIATICLLAFTFALGVPSLAEDDDQQTYVDDDQGNRTYYDDNGQPTRVQKTPPKPQPAVAPATPDPPRKKGKNVKLPNGGDAYQAGDGSVRYMDPNGNMVTVKPNNNPDGHTIIQNLLNGINAITNEGGGSAYTIPNVGNFSVDPYGRLTGTPWFKWDPNGGYSPGLDSIPNLTHQTNVDPYSNGGIPITTYTYTDPNTGKSTTITEGQQTKGNGSSITITDPNGNKIVNTTNMGTHIFGPDGKAISHAAGAGHHHGPGGTEIPDGFFFPTGLKNRVQPAPMKTSSPDKGSQGMYMKGYDNDVEPESPQSKPQKPGHTSQVKITAKQSGPFRITAEVEQPADPSTHELKATGGGMDQ